MKRRRRRKCVHCLALFYPDRRNLRHQKYSSEPACRKASKAASQRRWLNKHENWDYFRGPANVQRVQAWRATHPGNWRHSGLIQAALKEDLPAQVVENEDQSAVLTAFALEDLWSNQGVVLIGLIAHLTGTALQDDIAETARRLVGLGRDILDPEGDRYADKTRIVPSTGRPDSAPVQLGRSAPGPQ